MYTSRCEHQTWINGAPNNAAQWIPCPFIEPVQEIVKTILHHVRCGPVVKPMQNQHSSKIHTTGYNNGLTKQGMPSSFTYLAHVKRKDISGNGLVNRFIIKNLKYNVPLCFFIKLRHNCAACIS